MSAVPMGKLYVSSHRELIQSNPPILRAAQVVEFYYFTGASTERVVWTTATIQPDQEVLISGDALPLDVIARVIAHHKKYGLVASDAMPRNYHGLAYRVETVEFET
jgi:hypothetical protein